jgi:hypothetical protein
LFVSGLQFEKIGVYLRASAVDKICCPSLPCPRLGGEEESKKDVQTFDFGLFDSVFCNISLQNRSIFSVFAGTLSKDPFMRLLRLHSRSANGRGK